MTENRFYFYGKNNRHVVQVVSEPTDGKVQVAWVMLSPLSVGASRRGRHPDLSEPVALDSLQAVEQEEVLAAAAEVVAKPAGGETN